MRALKRAAATVGLASWATSAFLWHHYAVTRPSMRPPGEGRSYPLNEHGTVVYLTAGEHILLYSLMAVGVLFYALTAFCHWIEKRRESVRGTLTEGKAHKESERAERG